MSPYVNIHTHQVGEGVCILDIGNGNVTEEENEIQGMRRVFYSVGVHPMNSVDTWAKAMSEVESALRMDKVIAVGECGLDRRSPICLEKQERIFKQQVELAERWHKPLIVHCVKAYSELITIKKQMLSSVPWIVHGYNNNGQILRELLNHGFYISLGMTLLNPLSTASKLLRTIPMEALFLETDDKEVAIHLVYEAAGKILGVQMEELQNLIWCNYNKVFAK